jgi:hypothetical protein
MDTPEPEDFDGVTDSRNPDASEAVEKLAVAKSVLEAQDHGFGSLRPLFCPKQASAAS